MSHALTLGLSCALLQALLGTSLQRDAFALALAFADVSGGTPHQQFELDPLEFAQESQSVRAAQSVACAGGSPSAPIATIATHAATNDPLRIVVYQKNLNYLMRVLGFAAVNPTAVYSRNTLKLRIIGP